MKTDSLHAYSGTVKWHLIIILVLVALTGVGSSAMATYSLPAERSVPWLGNVGVNGDIPSRTTIYKTLSPSGGDDTAAIQAAIGGCPTGQVVKLAAGTFSVSTNFDIKSGITLRGASKGATIIKGVAGHPSNSLMRITSSGSGMGATVSLSAGFTKGSTTITTAAAHGWKVGDIVLIDQLNNAQDDPPVNNIGNNGTCTWCGRSSGTRSLSQMVKITAVPSATTATLEIPLYWNFDAGLAPQATKINAVTTDTGIEDLTVDNSLSGGSQQDAGATIKVYYAANCWLRNVEVVGSYQSGVRFQSTYRNTIRNCEVHEGTPALPVAAPQYGPSRAYGISFYTNNSALLIEDNTLYHLFTGIMSGGSNSGNVIAYNYFAALYDGDNQWNGFAVMFHGAHPVMNLLEGNYIASQRLSFDWVWGGSSHNTLFRNRVALENRPYGTWDINIDYNNQYWNLVGNILGSSAVETYYRLENQNISSSYKAIYKFGYTSDGDSSAAGNDPKSLATALLHGNWDSVNKSVSWNGTDDRVLPASLYLGKKPGWWGTMAWPAIGPDLSPMYPAAPALGTGTPWDAVTAKTIPAPTLHPVQ